MKMNIASIVVILSLSFGAGAQDFREADRSGEKSPIPASPFQPDLMPGYVLIEGDIQVPIEQFEALIRRDPELHSIFGNVSFWPGGIVPYDFVTAGAGAVSANNQTAATNAMGTISLHSGVAFRPAVTADASRIRFQDSRFNSSPVGQQGGVQIITIADWGIQIKICHEIYHSLGFWHEQSREDRDDFITINWGSICGSNVSSGCTPGTNVINCCLCQDTAGKCISCFHNFETKPSTSIYGPYDFDSMMHYGRADFSCDTSDTITVKAPWNATWQNHIGQTDHLSRYDIITCRGIYPFSNDRWLDRDYGGASDGTFQRPYRDTMLAAAVARVSAGGTLFIKYSNTYSAGGTYGKQVTLVAGDGVVILGE